MKIFFLRSSFGSKHSFSGDLEAILGSIIDWSVLDTLNVFLDIATTITDKNRVSSLFLKSSSMYSVPSMYNLHQSDKYAFFTASLGRFGGVQVKQHVEGDDKPCKFIIYNCSKRTFAGKAKQDKFSGFAGKHFTAESLWHSCSDKKTVLTHDWFNNRFTENMNEIFPLRIEGRYSALNVDVDLLHQLRENAMSVYNREHLVELDTSLYFKYLNDRRALLFDMHRHFVRKIDRSSLSALALISYMLSSLVLSPNRKYRECRDFVLAHRRRDNDLLFLPDQFYYDGDILEKCFCY
ncbi:hypothetical protein MFLAVUS_011132 [Mucor flavus]|uniref:Uncharacterized protein n=1 Tax=Mucor flavus TaxID=439312 RepID=A0ABP9ZEW6_9FUNG